ncbi:aldo/keto reductase [Sinanaerobacter chloroacetimidivorans]|uniref:Aldo/keto reductase n=1 Tax=Sinanaerobacter chloroacetimidivorans TaxID=2818044 RepID=A0A8J8B1Q4_9FIRM|nr:aldo/keto reductase [Sinanaerobacter chloroacetimidivorans]MBR0597982.1 aldo/keto reductase [Sinanaerobacter chloroacetimidivorans]
MKYRTFQKTGERISLLGFGTMRLPILDGNPGEINEKEAIAMIRNAIDKGINYIDTAYMYHDGNSEVVVGKALKDGYREKVLLANKMPAWFAKSEEDIEKIFEEQFRRLDVDCIDMYLVHNITVPIWKRVLKYNVLEFLEKKREEGKIKHIGFSFHDDFTLFQEVIDYYPWDFCQIQLNYMDAEFQAGVKGLKYAGSKGIPVIVMEPLKGGKLTDILPKTIQEFWQQAPIKRTPAEWALRWVADFPEVLTILSGMNSMEQVDENIRVIEAADPSSLTAKEQAIIKSVADEYNKLIQYSCTECKYCMPCPLKIQIPAVISLYNDWYLYEGNHKVKADFDMWMSPDRRPSACIACKACEGHCPQHLPISDIMVKAKEIFE